MISKIKSVGSTKRTVFPISSIVFLNEKENKVIFYDEKDLSKSYKTKLSYIKIEKDTFSITNSLLEKVINKNEVIKRLLLDGKPISEILLMFPENRWVYFYEWELKDYSPMSLSYENKFYEDKKFFIPKSWLKRNKKDDANLISVLVENFEFEDVE